MGKVSSVGPKTEIGKQILQDFRNYKVTGFKPFGKGVGGVNHYRSRGIYQTVSQSAFRSQAKKIAELALKDMPECTYDDDGDEPSDLEKKNSCNGDTDDDASVNNDAGDRNHSGRPDDVGDSSDDDDDSYTCSSEDSCSDDSLKGFDDIELGELQNSRAPFFTGYPTGDKLLVIFPLDGNVLDPDANKFEFINNNNAIRRLGKIPKERTSCVDLIADRDYLSSAIGFSEVDLMLVDAEIKKRMQANQYLRDENGDMWETRATLQLPFKCDPHFRGRDGKVLETFPMRRNKHGFSWGYFWLLAWKPPKPKTAKRIGGTLEKIVPKEDSTVWTEETFISNRK